MYLVEFLYQSTKIWFFKIVTFFIISHYLPINVRFSSSYMYGLMILKQFLKKGGNLKQKKNFKSYLIRQPEIWPWSCIDLVTWKSGSKGKDYRFPLQASYIIDNIRCCHYLIIQWGSKVGIGTQLPLFIQLNKVSD